MNEQRMSPSGVNASGINSILVLGSTNNAAGALTRGAGEVIEAELKAQKYQLEAASEFAEEGAQIVDSQLLEVQKQATRQKGGDSDAAWGEIGGGILGLTLTTGGLGVGKFCGGDSDELKELNEFKGRLDKQPEGDVVAQGAPSATTSGKTFADELDRKISEVVGNKDANDIRIKALKGAVERLNAEITEKETAIERCEVDLKTLRFQINRVNRSSLMSHVESGNSQAASDGLIKFEKEKETKLQGLNTELTTLRNRKVNEEEELAHLQKDSNLSELKKQKELYEKLTTTKINDNGKPELNLSGLNKYDGDTQEAVLKGMSTEEKARLRTHFDRAYARASKASQEIKARKWGEVGSAIQVSNQSVMSMSQGVGQEMGLDDHMKATNYGARAQVYGTLGGQYTQAASSKANEADSNLRTALQVAQSIRG